MSNAANRSGGPLGRSLVLTDEQIDALGPEGTRAIVLLDVDGHRVGEAVVTATEDEHRDWVFRNDDRNPPSEAELIDGDEAIRRLHERFQSKTTEE